MRAAGEVWLYVWTVQGQHRGARGGGAPDATVSTVSGRLVLHHVGRSSTVHGSTVDKHLKKKQIIPLRTKKVIKNSKGKS